MFPTKSPPLPTPPAAPPNAPTFGADALKSKSGGGTPPQFNASVLGSLATQTANKTLLGQ